MTLTAIATPEPEGKFVNFIMTDDRRMIFLDDDKNKANYFELLNKILNYTK